MSDSSNQGRFGGRWFIPAVVVVALVIVLVIVLVITNLAHSGNKPEAQTPTASSAPSKSSSTVPADAKSVCGLKGYDTTNELSGTPRATWQVVGTFPAPTDEKGAGPGVIDSSGFRSCYAHTAEGALFATANFAALGTDATMYPKMSALVADGPGKSAIEQLLKSNSGASTDGTRAQLAGFKIDSYSADVATVDLALNYSDGTLVSAPLKVQWADGDWKVVLADDGSFPIAPSPLQSLGGYTPWAAQGA
jgi:hypothetical protein